MLNKGFLRNRYQTTHSTRRIWISVFFGFVTALGVYFLFTFFRDIFRVMEFSISNGPLLIDSSERFWQNINFAMLSVVLGNSIFLGYLFKRPIKSKMANYKRLTIQNDQTFFGFNFFYVFFKMFLLFGIFAASNFDYKVFSNYTELFILLSIAIYLESWKTILLLYRTKVYKYILLNVLVLIALIFVFGKISVLDTKKIDALLLDNNPRVELPTSSFYIDTWNLKCFIKLVNQNGQIKYIINDIESSIEELPQRINKNVRYELSYLQSVYLLAPYDIEIYEIKKLEKLFFRHNHVKLMYIIQKEKPDFTSRFSFYGIPKNIFFQESVINSFEEEMKLSPSPPSPVFFRNFNFKNYSFVNVKIDKEISFNGKLIKEENLLEEFKSMINNKTIFHFKFKDSISYQNYITVFSNYKQAIFELRDEEETIKHGDSFQSKGLMNKYNDDQKRLKKKYPTLYIENYIFDK